MVSSSPYFPVPSRMRAKPDRLRAFVDEHYDRLWRVLRRFGVPVGRIEDAAQEVLLVLARRIDGLPEQAEWGFVCGVARRVAADGRRYEASRPPLECAQELHTLPDPRAGSALTSADERQLLDRLLDGLADEQREVIVLIELEGMTMAEVSELLEVPPGTVASRLRRARAHLETAAREMRDGLAEKGWSL